jgi:lysozyme family protein
VTLVVPTNKGRHASLFMIAGGWKAGASEKRTVKLINDYEIGKIYKAHYWDKIAGDELPSGLDYCTFDFAVNSGVSRAIRFLQRVAAVSNSGTVDAETLAGD